MPSIAVLPFQNISGDPEQEYFADGVVEEIITALSRFRSLFVIARNSSFSYKGKSPDIRQVGRELGVRYVLEGSIRMAANRIRVISQLIDTLSALAFAQFLYHMHGTAVDRDTAWREGFAAATSSVEVDRANGYSRARRAALLTSAADRARMGEALEGARRPPTTSIRTTCSH